MGGCGMNDGAERDEAFRFGGRTVPDVDSVAGFTKAAPMGKPIETDAEKCYFHGVSALLHLRIAPPREGRGFVP